MRISGDKGKWVPMDHSKSKKHEGVAVYLAIASNLSKKIRIAEFEHFTHQLVIVPSYPISTAGQSRLLSLLWCSLEGIRKRSSFGFWKFRSRSY